MHCIQRSGNTRKVQQQRNRVLYVNTRVLIWKHHHTRYLYIGTLPMNTHQVHSPVIYFKMLNFIIMTNFLNKCVLSYRSICKHRFYVCYSVRYLSLSNSQCRYKTLQLHVSITESIQLSIFRYLIQNASKKVSKVK